MMKIILVAILSVTAVFIYTTITKKGASMPLSSTIKTQNPDNLPTAYLGGGCFWCLESQVRALEGVVFTASGYQGGHVEMPTYEQVTTGNTGHAEVVAITYDPDIISYKDLVIFFLTKGHDATQLNRQGVDVGTQYRSAIFYSSEEEKQAAEEAIKEVNASDYYDDTPIVTTLQSAQDYKFWLAEDYHQQYYEKYEDTQGKTHIRVLLKEDRETFK